AEISVRILLLDRLSDSKEHENENAIAFRTTTVAIVAAVCGLMTAVNLVRAQPLQPEALVSFNTNNGPANPYGNLVQGKDGACYGTTVHGGSSDYGTVFRVTPNAEHHKWRSPKIPRNSPPVGNPGSTGDQTDHERLLQHLPTK